jgi:hypothetical protein
MLQVSVLNVSSALDVCCIQVFRVSEVCSKSHWGTTQEPWEGRGEPRGVEWGAWRVYGIVDGACSSSSWLLDPARVEREEGVGGRSGRHRTGQSKVDGRGVHMRVWTRHTGKDCSDTMTSDLV